MEIAYQGAREQMYPKQRAAVYDGHPISVIEASTKAGKTISCLAWLLEQALKGKDGQQFWWVAPVFGQAEIGHRRMKARIPAKLVKSNQSNLTLSLANGTRIWFKSAERPDDLYGEDVWAVVMDEASRMREDAWVAITSTLTYTKGPARIIGNVKGKKNWFYTLARQAEKGDPDLGYHKITCWDAVEAGILSREWVEAKRRDLERLGRGGAFRQLYEAEAAGDADNPFGLDAIYACVVDDYSTERAAVAGVDLAGRGAQNINPAAEVHDRDYAAIVKLDKNGHMTLLRQFRKDPIAVAEEVARVVGKTPTLIDSTGQGDETVLRLQRRGDMRVEGFRYTEVSRQDLLEGLALAIGAGAVKFPDEPLGEEGAPSLVTQLEAFEYDYTGRGERWVVPKGHHDDAVMALALAVKKLPWRRNVKAPEGVEQQSKWTEDAEGTAWRAYKESQKPTLLQEPVPARESVPLPVIVGGGGGRWSGADR